MPSVFASTRVNAIRDDATVEISAPTAAPIVPYGPLRTTSPAPGLAPPRSVGPMITRSHAEHPELRPLVQRTLAYRERACRGLDVVDLQTHYPEATGNAVELYEDGQSFFPRVLSDIRQATRFIHITTFAFGGSDDRLSGELTAELVAARRRGVEVRIKLEPGPSGAHRGGGRSYVEQLRAAGVEVVVNSAPSNTSTCLPDVRPVGLIEHRKLYIMDDGNGGVITHTGGMNIQDRYRDTWRDSMVRIEGEAALHAQIDFVNDWLRVGGHLGSDSDDNAALEARYFPRSQRRGAVTLQATQSVPRINNAARARFLAAIEDEPNNGFVYIATPYITDSAICDALIAAAKRGVDVRIVVPANADIAGVSSAIRASIEPKLLDAGVQVYAYHGGDRDNPRMMHAKQFATSRQASFGSYNLDALSRSNLELNYWTTTPEMVRRVRAAIERDFSASDRSSSDGVTGWQRSIGPLLAPLVDFVL